MPLVMFIQVEISTWKFGKLFLRQIFWNIWMQTTQNAIKKYVYSFILTVKFLNWNCILFLASSTDMIEQSKSKYENEAYGLRF